MMTIHRYKLQDQASGEWVVQLTKGPEELIRTLGGRIIAGTAEEVDSANVDEQGRYVPTTSGTQRDRLP